MISSLLLNASTQSILTFQTTPRGKGKARADGLRQTTISSFVPKKVNEGRQKAVAQPQSERLKAMALKKLGLFFIS